MTDPTTDDDLPPALPFEEALDNLAADKADELPKPKASRAKTDKPDVAKAPSDKVTIIIDEPSGNNGASAQQYFGLNGKGFLIRFGEPVTVPREFLNLLDELIQTKTIPLADGGFSERDFKRFSYRVVRD